MPTIEIPEIYIPEIYIPEPYTPDIPIVTQYLEINPPGCTYGHRDIKNTGNHNLLLDDPNGVYTICDFTFPNFIPPIYNPNQMTMIEESLPQGGDPEIPKTETPKIPDEKEENIVIPECPSSKDQRVGDYRNAKKLEIVVGHRLDKTECITLYEDVPFKDQYIPSANQFIGVFSLALVGASAPVVLQLVRPLVKQAVSKLSKKKETKL
jgi:serine/threonine protein kinase